MGSNKSKDRVVWKNAMEIFPNEIFVHIFLFLDTQSVFSGVSKVCKKFWEMVNSKFFMKTVFTMLSNQYNGEILLEKNCAFSDIEKMKILHESFVVEKTIPNQKILVKTVVVEILKKYLSIEDFRKTNRKMISKKEILEVPVLTKLDRERLLLKKHFVNIIKKSKYLSPIQLSIKSFLGEIEDNGIENIPSTEVLSYCKSVGTCVSRKLEINDNKMKQKIEELCISVIFSIIGNDIMKNITKDKHSRDSKVNKNKEILKKISPAKIGIEQRFIEPKKKYQFIHAINILNHQISIVKFMKYPDPNEIGSSFFSACESVAEKCKEVIDQNKSENVIFGADDFFPIIIYVLGHSSIQNFSSLFSFIDSFNPKKSDSETIYYLTLLIGALEYIHSENIEENF